MIWWIVGAIVAVALVVFVVVALGTVRRLAGLQSAVARLDDVAGDAEPLVAAVATLQSSLGFVQARAERVQAHIQAIKSARGKSDTTA